MNKVNKNLTSFADHLNQQYGERGSVELEKFEESFEAFKLGVMLQEMRKEIQFKAINPQSILISKGKAGNFGFSKSIPMGLS